MNPDSGDKIFILYFLVLVEPQGDGDLQFDTIQSVWFYSKMKSKRILEQQCSMINHFFQECLPLLA